MSGKDQISIFNPYFPIFHNDPPIADFRHVFPLAFSLFLLFPVICRRFSRLFPFFLSSDKPFPDCTEKYFHPAPSSDDEADILFPELLPEKSKRLPLSLSLIHISTLSFSYAHPFLSDQIKTAPLSFGGALPRRYFFIDHARFLLL